MIISIFVRVLNLFRNVRVGIFKRYLKSRFPSGGESVIFYGKDLPIIKGERNIYLGKGVKINEFAYLYARNNSKIYIGDRTTISSFANIITAGYDVNLWLREEPEDTADIHLEKNIIIGNHCWVASNATILPGVQITGSNVIIASGAVVTKSYLESDIILGGTPAKIIRKL